MKIDIEDIKLLAEFEGFIQSPTNEYLWRKPIMLGLPLNDLIIPRTLLPTQPVKYPQGKLIDVSKGGMRLSSMRFNESFDWLIPVIQKCKKIADNRDIKEKGYHFHHLYDIILECLRTLDINLTYSSVVAFVRSYSKYKEEIIKSVVDNL